LAADLKAACQDNETSWFDWTLLEKHADVHRFLKLLTARRLLRGTEHELQGMSLNRLIREANKAWHGVRLNQPDWSDHSHSVALTAEIRREKLLFASPRRRWIDTARETPDGRRDSSEGAGLAFPDLSTVPIRGFRPGLTKVELPQ
jgi:isoamylase